MPFVVDHARIYLDYNSTTPCSDEVVSAMLPYFSDEFGNASSPHEAGRGASKAVDRARDEVSGVMGTPPESIVFTSGATEANNLAILGTAKGPNDRRKIIVGATEHKSVLEPCHSLRGMGFEVQIAPVHSDGVIDIHSLERLVDDQVRLVSIQGANNESGVLQPVRAIADIAHAKGALIHCDLVQMLGKVPVSVSELRIDLASFSAHKLYGPKGVGALVIGSAKARRALSPVVYGGGHEKGLRAGG